MTAGEPYPATGPPKRSAAPTPVASTTSSPCPMRARGRMRTDGVAGEMPLVETRLDDPEGDADRLE